MHGKRGIASLKLSELKEWFADHYPFSFKKNQPKERIRIQVYLYDDEFYRLNVYCIKNDISRGKFVKSAIRRELQYQKSLKKGRLF